MAAGGPVSGLRVGNVVGRKCRCLNHYLLENSVWVKREVGAVPAPPCTLFLSLGRHCRHLSVRVLVGKPGVIVFPSKGWAPGTHYVART